LRIRPEEAFPATIDVDKVTAQLDKGILRVIATKAPQEKAAPAAA
jgi:HSP20 family molecular chaperone IbpA